LAPRPPPLPLHQVHDLRLDGKDRAERGRGVLRDEGDRAAAHAIVHHRGVLAEEVGAIEAHIATAGGGVPGGGRGGVVLPQPLSPPRPTTSPRPMSRLMESSTWATPPSVTKSTLSSRTDRSSVIARGTAAAQPRVEDVAQAVAEQVESHDGEEDGQAGRRRVPPRI